MATFLRGYKQCAYLIGFLLFLFGPAASDLSPVHGPIETCNREHFNASCGPNQVILIKEAKYGRMGVGRCVKRDLGYLGCGVDVLSHLDTACSGRQKCFIKIPDDHLYETQPCPEDTVSYLETTYRCLPVQTATDSECRRKRVLRRPFEFGYLASSTTDLTGFGSLSCPWLIEAHPGQKINISLLNFLQHVQLPSESGVVPPDIPRTGICYEIAVIKDGGSKETILSCQPNKRESAVYTSTTHKVEITIPKRNTESVAGSFLLKFQAVGCPTISAPKDASVQYISKTNAMVRCNSTQEVWYLTCKDHSWIGKQGNCTSSGHANNPWGFGRMLATEDSFPFGILVAVSIGVALGVFFGGLLLAIVIIHSKRKRQQRRRALATRPAEAKLPSYLTSVAEREPEWPSEVKLLETNACGAHHTLQHGTLQRMEIADEDHSQYVRSQSTLGRPRPHYYESPKFV